MRKNKYGKVCGSAKDGIDFWNEGKIIEVSAKDQIKLLVKLKDYKLTFQRKHIDIVKELMVVDQTEDYILRAKSGWTVDRCSKYKEGRDLGWYVGYVEYKHDSYFFAVRLEKGVNDTKESFSRDRIGITKSALLHQFGLQLE
jgi:beta-lactamase class D